jgi:GR25 family glycosyltransferase involved in LPS biosynthesis
MKQLSGNVPIPMDNAPFSIPTYIINLKKRADRKEHAIAQFNGRDEFELTVIEAFEHSFGALGLWMTIRYILHDLVSKDADYIIICEDDIEFTEHYTKDQLFAAVAEAKNREADVLLGGVSWFDNTVHITNNVFWTNQFTGLHFTVIFKQFFPVILETILRYYFAADHQIASLSNNIMFIHPPLAIQKEFGYSDATPKNNVEGSVPGYFKSVNERFHFFQNASFQLEHMINSAVRLSENISYDTVIIPTYIINLPERIERLAHIKKEFAGKPEFDVQIVEACKHEVGALGLWLSIRKIIDMAVANDDDVIIISEDDHQFTSDYSKAYLLENIIEAFEEGACFLSGGSAKFDNAIPVTRNRFWVYHCLVDTIYGDF